MTRSILIPAEHGDLLGRLQQMSLKELWMEALKYGDVALEGRREKSSFHKRHEVEIKFTRKSGSSIRAKGATDDSVEQAFINAIMEAVKLKDY